MLALPQEGTPMVVVSHKMEFMKAWPTGSYFWTGAES